MAGKKGILRASGEKRLHTGAGDKSLSEKSGKTLFQDKEEGVPESISGITLIVLTNRECCRQFAGQVAGIGDHNGP